MKRKTLKSSEFKFFLGVFPFSFFFFILVSIFKLFWANNLRTIQLSEFFPIRKRMVNGLSEKREKIALFERKFKGEINKLLENIQVVPSSDNAYDTYGNFRLKL